MSSIVLERELREINECRQINGMPPIAIKKIRCMKCGALFDSWDTKKERHCEYCNYLRYRQNAGSMGLR